MFSRYFFSIFLLALLSGMIVLVSCKGPPKKGEAGLSSELTEDQASQPKGGWPWIIKEGWLDDDTFQAYHKEPLSSSIEEHIVKAKKRMAWLMLLDTYELTKEDESIANQLANSKLFTNLGIQKVHHKTENGKVYILIKKTGKKTKLKEEWQHACLRIEDKISRLTDLRKGW